MYNEFLYQAIDLLPGLNNIAYREYTNIDNFGANDPHYQKKEYSNQELKGFKQFVLILGKFAIF